MAAFLILSQTREIARGHFEARVFVVPTGGAAAGLATRSECRMFEDGPTAAAECARMAEAMKLRLLRWGHEVVAADAPAPRAGSAPPAPHGDKGAVSPSAGSAGTP